MTFARNIMIRTLVVCFVLVFVNSAFPPRMNPESPQNRVSRCFILSKYFYFSHYSRTPMNDEQDAYYIHSSPAHLDWARYVAETMMILSATGLVCLIARRRSRPRGEVESSSLLTHPE